MYADATTISLSSKDPIDLQNNLNDEQIKLKEWLQGNKLPINVVKTQALVIGSSPNIRKIENHPDVQPSFMIDNLPIENVRDIKYLGVQIDNRLNWDKHIQKTSSKASQALGLIKYSKRFLKPAIRNDMYRGIVEPHLS